jgi:hypothetical protein
MYPRCHNCQYDLTGIVGPVCPECGVPCADAPPNRRSVAIGILIAATTVPALLVLFGWYGDKFLALAAIVLFLMCSSIGSVLVAIPRFGRWWWINAAAVAANWTAGCLSDVGLHPLAVGMVASVVCGIGVLRIWKMETKQNMLGAGLLLLSGTTALGILLLSYLVGHWGAA